MSQQFDKDLLNKIKIRPSAKTALMKIPTNNLRRRIDANQMVVDCIILHKSSPIFELSNWFEPASVLCESRLFEEAQRNRSCWWSPGVIVTFDHYIMLPLADVISRLS